MIELINSPLFLPCEPPAKSNLHIDYKLLKVPPHLIKNKNLRNQKERWIKAQKAQREMVRILRLYKIENDLKTIDKKNKIYVSAHFYLSNKRRKDLDNCAKSFFDALTKSTIIYDDSQVVISLLQKSLNKEKPGIEIHSIVHSLEDSLEDRANWIKGMTPGKRER